MRHRKNTRKLNRTPAHMRAMLANGVASLIKHERITTTQVRADALCRLAERIVSLAKKGDLHSRRRAIAVLRDKEAVSKLFKVLGPRYKERNGGYTRIMKALFRKGDGAPMAVCELVDTTVPVRVRKAKKDDTGR